MCKADGGEILSNIELVLPWNVVNTCYHLEKEGQSCFLALNGEENTSSQITVKKQADDSVKITVTVMALNSDEKGGKEGGGGDTEEEEEEDDEEEDEEDEPRGRRSNRTGKKDDSPSRTPRKGNRSGSSPSGNIFDKMGGAGGSTSKIAKLRQQGKASPASEAARKLIHSLDETPKKKGRGKKSIKCEEEEEQKKKKRAAAQQELAESTEEESSQNKDTPIVTYEKKARGKRQRPIYMPEPKKSKRGGEEEEEDEEEEEEEEEEDEEEDEEDDEPQIEIENHGGSTIIIVKQTEEGSKGGKRGRRQQPLKKRWSEMHAKEATGREHEMFRDPYDLDMPDDGIGVQKNIIQPSNKRRRTTAFPGTPAKKRSLREGDIECKFCDARVIDHAYLYRHARKMHSDESELMTYLDELRPLVQFPCSFCQEVFDENAALYDHMKEVHQDCVTIAEYGCPECDKKFKTSGAYQRHMKKAHGENPEPEDDELNCSLCSKSFTTETQLVNHHKVTHDAAEMYECDVCHKFYNTKGKLRRHRLIHGEFRFFCSYCNKGFHMRDNMNKHIRIMHESYETPQNECPHCGKTFLVKGNLTQHIKGVHLKQFAFNCSRCNMGFHRIKSLQQHLDICMGEATPTRPPRSLKVEKSRAPVEEEEMEEEEEATAPPQPDEKEIHVNAANTIVVAPEVVTAVVETEDGQITQEDALRIMEMAIESTQEA